MHSNIIAHPISAHTSALTQGSLKEKNFHLVLFCFVAVIVRHCWWFIFVLELCCCALAHLAHSYRNSLTMMQRIAFSFISVSAITETFLIIVRVLFSCVFCFCFCSCFLTFSHPSFWHKLILLDLFVYEMSWCTERALLRLRWPVFHWYMFVCLILQVWVRSGERKDS